MTPDISVVVPVRDGEATLPALLESLSRQTLSQERFELIVVDNASRDASAAIARDAGALVLSEPVPNRSLARNRGVRASSGSVLAFTDADCVAKPGWLEGFLTCAGGAPLKAGPVRITTANPPSAIERFEALWRFAQEHWVHEGWAVTANLSVRRDAFDKVDGFDPAYRHYGEDVDFCLRCARIGLQIELCPDAVVSHYAEQELRPMLRRAFHHGYGASQVLHRVGFGHEAWRHPAPLLHTRGAMGLIGLRPEMFAPGDRRRMRELSRLAYGARIAGSVWAALTRAR